ISHCGGAGQLSSAHRNLKDQRYAEGHYGSGMVHSLVDRALLFSASQRRNATAGMSLGPATPMKPSNENMPHSPGRTLVVMAKAPRPGTVKTRLAQSLPVEAVTELYRC